MYKGKTVGIVIPAYNEEILIGKTLSTMPDFVDNMIVINDCSKDKTLEKIKEFQAKDPRIIIINHEKNKGLGQSLIDGYVKCRDLGLDITAVMAGDAQMSPDDLPSVLDPIAEGRADYSKGNRLLVKDVAKHMPLHRLIGNAGLTFLTKFATGYWHIIDPQCGYTAISHRALSAIPIESMIKGYGYNADILNMLNILEFPVADVEVKPVYGEEKSKIKLYKYIPNVSILLIKLFFRRLVRKYLVRNFNPLCLSYFAGLFLFFFGALPFASLFLYRYAKYYDFPQTSLLSLMFLTIASMQILLSAIQYDMEDNRHLCVYTQKERREFK